MKFIYPKNFFILAAIIFLSNELIYSQQDTAAASDSIQPNLRIEVRFPVIDYIYDEFELTLSLNLLKAGIFVPDGNRYSRELYSIGLLSGINTIDHFSEPQINFINPLMFQYQDDQKLSGIRFFLGAMQTAAVGYLAYKHIKKYGLFK